jgi:hypothetical protein
MRASARFLVALASTRAMATAATSTPAVIRSTFALEMPMKTPDPFIFCV